MTDGRNSPLGLGVGQHVVGVKALTFEGNKKVTRSQCAGIRHNPCESGSAPPQELCAGDPVHHIIQAGHIGHATSAT